MYYLWRFSSRKNKTLSVNLSHFVDIIVQILDDEHYPAFKPKTDKRVCVVGAIQNSYAATRVVWKLAEIDSPKNMAKEAISLVHHHYLNA